MSKSSDYFKNRKEKDIKFFFGEVKNTSNKYFTFNHVVDDDNIVIITNNIASVKGNPVLLVDNNKAVYLKDWQLRPVHNYHEGVNAYAVKLNRYFFKVYTFKSDFEGMAFEQEDNFDSLKKTAAEQNMPIALGHMG